jgi:ABC-type oligopeptide transport system ATPase subunit
MTFFEADEKYPPIYPDNYPILQARGLRKHFPVSGGRKLVAVDGVDLDLIGGKTLALVGESGSGKSTVARCIVRLVQPTGGEVILHGQSITALNSVAMSRKYRNMQMVFQDPKSSLNPRMTVRQMLEEPLCLHLKLPRAARDERVRELVDMVGLTDAHLDRYPHQLSGGQRQRIGIARALAVQPELVILDEPTASLDVSVRGQVLDLLADLQKRFNLAYLFISHDLQVVRHIADQVAVMFLGEIVEKGPVTSVFSDPQHPYTKRLLAAVPVPDPTQRKPRRPAASREMKSPIRPGNYVSSPREYRTVSEGHTVQVWGEDWTL